MQIRGRRDPRNVEVTVDSHRTGEVPPGQAADRFQQPVALERVLHVGGRLQDAINTVIEGKPEVVRTAVTVLLAQGHLLLEDVPGPAAQRHHRR